LASLLPDRINPTPKTLDTYRLEQEEHLPVTGKAKMYKLAILFFLSSSHNVSDVHFANFL